MIIIFLLIYFSSVESIQADELIQFPHSQSLASYALKLINEGKIQDKGYTFSKDDLYIGRVDHVFQFQDKTINIEYKMAVRCNLASKPIEKDADHMYYLTNSVILDSNGEVSGVYPSLSFDACSSKRDGLNNNHVETIHEIKFSPDFELITNQADQISQYVNQLIDTKEIKIYEHIFSANEIDMHSISFAEYIEPQINKVVLSFLPTCDVTLKISKENTAILSTLYVYLLPDKTIENIHATFKIGTVNTCSDQISHHQTLSHY